MEEVFFEEFCASYSDHVESVWRSNSILPYILGGNPRLAQIFAMWLHHFEEGRGEDDNGNVDEFVWPGETVEISGHTISGLQEKINTAECMRYLTAKADPIKILGDPLIKDVKPYLWKVASSSTPVDIFDKSTWGGDDFSPLHKLICCSVAIHASQNQRVENHVQATAQVRKTNVGEARGTARVRLHSYLIRRYNSQSISAKKAKLDNKDKRDKAQRTKDKE